MSLRNIRYWMNDARRRNYCGPTEAAILTKQGEVIRVPNMADWMGTHTILGTTKPEDVAATFIKAPKDGWCGEATVPGLRGAQNLYSRGHGDDLDVAVEVMINKLLEHGLKMVDLREPATRLEALLSTHDWYSAYSDDPSVVRAGDHDGLCIYKLLTEVPVQVARTLFSKHAPKDCTCPV